MRVTEGGGLARSDELRGTEDSACAMWCHQAEHWLTAWPLKGTEHTPESNALTRSVLTSATLFPRRYTSRALPRSGGPTPGTSVCVTHRPSLRLSLASSSGVPLATRSIVTGLPWYYVRSISLRFTALTPIFPRSFPLLAPHNDNLESPSIAPIASCLFPLSLHLILPSGCSEYTFSSSVLLHLFFLRVQYPILRCFSPCPAFLLPLR